MSASIESSNPVADLLGALTSEPADDFSFEIQALNQHLAALQELDADAEQVGACLDAFDSRLIDLTRRFVPTLLNPEGAFSDDNTASATRLEKVLLGFARLLQQSVAAALEASPEQSLDVASCVLCARAMRLLDEVISIGSMHGAPPPELLWETAYALYVMMAEVTVDDDNVRAVTAVMMHLKRIIAISVLQPESFTPREIDWLHDYLEFAVTVAQLSSEPIEPQQASFWARLDSDIAPVATTRQAPPHLDEDVDVLYFSALDMARRVSEQREWLGTRITEAEVVGLEHDSDLLDSESSGLPMGLTPVETYALLGRLHERWTAPPYREKFRAPHFYQVELCIGLRSIWYLARGASARVRLSTWMVCNESEGGYGLIGDTTEAGRVWAGMAVGLRKSVDDPWTICIVRWLRNKENGQTELGLQVLTREFVPVEIGFRTSEMRNTTPALVVNGVEGQSSKAAILAPVGTYTSRRFLLVRERPALYVGQGRVLSVELQTSSVELFNYELDRFPI